MELLKKHFDTALESPDGIKKLRELILTLAMQGKLVKQDPNDQPASDLLKEIQAEKERLIKEGKIKRQKELPPVKPEEVPYEVPAGWVWVRLGELFHVTSGVNLTKEKMITGNIPVYGGNGINGYHNDYNVMKSTIVIGRVGYYCGSIHLTPEKAWVTDNAFITIYDEKRLFQSYVIWLLKTIDLQNNKSATAQPVISGSKIYPILIPLPPLAEQKRIVAKIDELISLCGKLGAQRKARNEKRLSVHTAAINRLLTASDKNDFDSAWQFITRHFDPLYSVKENVTELKKAILTLAMQGKLVKQDPNDQPSSELLKEIQVEKERLIKEGKIKRQKELPPVNPEEVPYEVPAGWEWVNLRTVTHEWGQKTPDKDFSYIDVGSIDNSNGVIIDEPQVLTPGSAPSRARKIVKPGTVIYSTVRPYLLNIAIVEKDYVEEPIASTAFAIMHPFKGLVVKYLYRYLNSRIFIEFVESKQKGVAYPAISNGDLYQGLIPLPPFTEQNRIVTKIDELMALCDKLANQIEHATIKQTALFDAVLDKV